MGFPSLVMIQPVGIFFPAPRAISILPAATLLMHTANRTARCFLPGAAYANGLLPIAAARPPVGATSGHVLDIERPTKPRSAAIMAYWPAAP